MRLGLLFFCLLESLTPISFVLLIHIQSFLNFCAFFEKSLVDLSSPIWHCLVYCPSRAIAICPLIYFLVDLVFCYQFVLEILSVSHIELELL